jgi:hypothetical protein
MTGETLCLYDSAARPQPLVDIRMPPGAQCGGKPCWKATMAGFRYGDRDRAWDGVARAILKAGGDGRATVLLKANGLTIPFPTDAALPFTPPVRVQLQADNGQCWEAVYSTATRSDPEQFQARSD